jgi:thiazole synthase
MRHLFKDQILIVDAGIGKPSHASQAMELGFDAVLLNTAVAKAKDPIQMATAFKLAVSAGHIAYRSGLMRTRQNAVPSTPIVGLPFWHEEQ